LEGEDLSQTLARDGVPSVECTTDLLLASVAAVHHIGVVHRDLKPENIFPSEERGGIRPRVLDFGISKIMDPGDVERADADSDAAPPSRQRRRRC
jgi:eukaryotic-like serine/threonine-protein kinase